MCDITIRAIEDQNVNLVVWTLNPVFLQLHPRVERENSENQEALGGGQDTQEETQEMA